MAKWKYLNLDSLLEYTEALWLFFKRWDGWRLVPTAVHHLNWNDGKVYSVDFFSGDILLTAGYGVYWCVTDRRPDPVTLKKWGYDDEQRTDRSKEKSNRQI